MLSTVTALRFLSTILLAATAPALAADPRSPTTAPAAASEHVFELRKYFAMPGKLDALNARFRDHTCALFQKHGMQLIGFWVPSEGDEAGKVLIYVLAFPSKEAKETAWKGFRDDPEWKKAREESEKNGKLVEKVESSLMNATDYSAIK